MNENIHDQIATLKDILHFAEEALSVAAKIKSEQFREDQRESIEDDYRTDLNEVLKLADEIRNFDLIVMD